MFFFANKMLNLVLNIIAFVILVCLIVWVVRMFMG